MKRSTYRIAAALLAALLMTPSSTALAQRGRGGGGGGGGGGGRSFSGGGGGGASRGFSGGGSRGFSGGGSRGFSGGSSRGFSGGSPSFGGSRGFSGGSSRGFSGGGSRGNIPGGSRGFSGGGSRSTLSGSGLRTYNRGGGGESFSGRSFSGGSGSRSGVARSGSSFTARNFSNRSTSAFRGTPANRGATLSRNLDRNLNGARSRSFTARNFSKNPNGNLARDISGNRGALNNRYVRGGAGYKNLYRNNLYRNHLYSGRWNRWSGWGWGYPIGWGWGWYPIGWWGWPSYGLGYGGWAGYCNYAPWLGYGSWSGYGGWSGYSYASPYSTNVAYANVQDPIIAATTSSDASDLDFVSAGEQAFQAGQYEQAIKDWQHALVDDPNNGGIVLMMSQALFALGKYDDAAGAVQAAMQMLPEDEWGNVVKNYSQVYSNTQRYKDELRALEHARKDKTDDPAMRFLLGYEYGYLGYPKHAVTELDKALDLQPQDLGAQKLRDIFAAEAGLPARPHTAEPPSNPGPGELPAPQ